MMPLPSRRTGFVFFAISSVVFLTFLYVDRSVLQRRILDEGSPIETQIFLLRTGAIAFASFLAVLGCGFMRARPGERDACSSLSAWPISRIGQGLAAGIPLSVTVGLTLALFQDPESFHGWAREDGPVENLSALLAVLAGGVFASVAWRTRKSRGSWIGLPQVILGLLAVVCILIAGEEVSWLQRFFEFETPAEFAGNRQHEFNLHNFETDRTEIAYYLWAFVLAVLAPFFGEVLPFVRRISWMHQLVPGRFVAGAGALAVGFSYDRWDVLPIQAMFFVTATILLWFIRHGRGAAGGRLFPALVLIVLLTNQAVFLILGHTLVRNWEGTECREMLIPLSLLFCSMELWRRATPVCSDTPRSSRPA